MASARTSIGTHGLAWLILAAGLVLALPAHGGVLDEVRERGYVRCGVTEIAGYAEQDRDGNWRGFTIDFCRAVAAAVLSDPDAFEAVPVFANGRFTALTENQVDVVHANVTWTLSRETGRGIAFTAIMEYDGQGFIAHRDLGIARLDDVAGRNLAVCVVANTTTEGNIRDVNRQRDLGLTIRPFETMDASWDAFLGRQCDLLVADRTVLYLHRAVRAIGTDSTVILPDTISREPLTPIVRAGDSEWESLIRWIRHALVIAEDHGVTAANVAHRARVGDNAEVGRLLGRTDGMGALLGLDDAWGRRAIAAVGNYGEMFDRHLGAGSRFGMARGLNALWRDGGLLYAPPLR